jgi:6-phospho-3-hexuloisomerase
VNGDHIDKATEQILTELAGCLRQVPGTRITEAAILIEEAPHIFVVGAGRCGLCMRALAMRLMHLGKSAFVTGETTTPNIRASDLLIVGSGSGSTASLLTVAGIARQQGAVILLLTAALRSPLAALADYQITVPAQISTDGNVGSHGPTSQPLGTLFEQSLFILNDRLILELMKRMGVGPAQMAERHANLQ